MSGPGSFPNPSSGLRDATQAICLPLAGVALALAVSAAFIAMAGINAIEAYKALFLGAFGTRFDSGMTLNKSLPLLFTALSVAVAFKTGVFSIGAEGQMFMGALAATVAGVFAGGMPALSIILALGAGFVGGALWGFVPGLLRGAWGISEVITTIMMNYIALYITGYIVAGPLQDKTILFPQSVPVGAHARLPIILHGTTVHAGLILGLLATAGVYVLFNHTAMGFRLRAVGGNPGAARFAGIKVGTTIVAGMIVSGGIAGLGGASEVLGVYGMLTDQFSPGYGYLAIAVALLGRNEPIPTAVAALLFGALLTGANAMQSAVGVPSAVIYVVQGLTVLFVLAGMSLPRILRRRGGVG